MYSSGSDAWICCRSPCRGLARAEMLQLATCTGQGDVGHVRPQLLACKRIGLLKVLTA